MKVLVLNSGSSSLKYQLIDSDSEQVLSKGLAERIGMVIGKISHQSDKSGKIEIEVEMKDHDQAMDKVFALLTDPDNGDISEVSEIGAVGHRVVHGGEKFSQPVVVDNEILAEIDKMSALAPLHNPPNLTGIRACIRLMPGIKQIAVFDTAFHATMPDYAYTYALPYKYYTDYGVRRYGFHGTSHKYVAGKAIEWLSEFGLAKSSTKVVTCHLGNGCSMAAVVGGKVVDTSMGMTPAEGLVMGTRSGDLDPAILLYLGRELGASLDDIDNLINKKSGLLGVSGVSSDMRDLTQAVKEGNKRAALAQSIFCYRVKKYIGAYAAAMGGLDAIVFTGGIGENHYQARASICEGLEFLGLELDLERNVDVRSKCDLSKENSKARIFLIPTNEELMIAREVVQVVNA